MMQPKIIPSFTIFALLSFVLPLWLGCSAPKIVDKTIVSPSGEIEYDSNQLMMKSADEISAIVRKRIKRAQDIQNHQVNTENEGVTPEVAALKHLRDAMRIVLARPDQDGTRANAFSQLRRELQDINSLGTVLTDLTNEGLYALQTTTVPARRQLTYLILLENLIAEIRPEASTNDEFKKILTDLRNANLKVTDVLRAQARLSAMQIPVSPSETAKSILDKEAARERAEKRNKK